VYWSRKADLSQTMKYYVQRGEGESGPYTLGRLQREVAAGAVSPVDLVRGGDLAGWVPAAQVLSCVPISIPAAAFSPSAVHTGAQGYDVAANPVPPNLHWAIVLLLGMVTASVFTAVWGVVQALWVRRIKPESKALRFLLLALATVVISGIIDTGAPEFGIASGFLSLAAFVLIVFAEGAMRRDLEDYYNTTENIHLRLSGAMVFFFHVFYFQYHFSRIARWKKTGVLEPR
jgi:GYF domain 2